MALLEKRVPIFMLLSHQNDVSPPVPELSVCTCYSKKKKKNIFYGNGMFFVTFLKCVDFRQTEKIGRNFKG